MALEEVCSPAIIYVAFSVIHILIDVFKNSYNAALVKFIIMIVFTTLLNILCERGLGIVSVHRIYPVHYALCRNWF